MIRSFDGKTPKIAESAFVSEVAHVIADVEIGENSGLWPGVVVRGDVSSIKIGRNTIIEDNSVIHTDEPMEIGDNVVVGHGAVVHCKKIGNNTLIGNNAVVLGKAQIGSHCVIGAGCLVTQGMEIPDNSFVVGVPARIKGQVSPEQRLLPRAITQYYVGLLERYKQQGL
ncbi:gamma carbonic anhydrase family protein [Chloroflexota bacterium]